MIGSNSKFKKTWIERCRHLCVCPLIDHRREPIRMRELLGLLYNKGQTHRWWQRSIQELLGLEDEQLDLGYSQFFGCFFHFFLLLVLVDYWLFIIPDTPNPNTHYSVFFIKWRYSLFSFHSRKFRSLELQISSVLGIKKSVVYDNFYWPMNAVFVFKLIEGMHFETFFAILMTVNLHRSSKVFEAPFKSNVICYSFLCTWTRW